MFLRISLLFLLILIIRHDVSASWITEEWSGRDKKFLEIRKEIDALEKKKALNLQNVRKYESLALKNPLNPIHQYRWGYAANKLAKSIEQTSVLQSIIVAMENPKFPKSFQYARLLFIVNVKISPDVQFKKVGLRLHKRSPNDAEILYYLIYILDLGDSAAQKIEAEKFAKALVKLEPQKATSYSSLASVYWISWISRKTRSDGQQAIKNYQKYLQLSPPSDTFRPRALDIIKSIQQELKSP